MEGLGLSLDDIEVEYLGYTEAARAMQDGILAGASLVAGMPVPAVAQLFASPIDVQILEFTEEQLAAINDVFPTWDFWEIPAGTYPGQDKPVNTIAQPNWLAVNYDVCEDVVYTLTKTLFENLDFMHGIHAAAQQIKVETATLGLPVPLHPGAIRFFEEQGLEIPDRLIP